MSQKTNVFYKYAKKLTFLGKNVNFFAYLKNGQK